MGTLYENISKLCLDRNIKPGRVCNDLGLSRGLMTDLKMGRKKTVNAETAQKIADYFGITVSNLLGWDNPQQPMEFEVPISELRDTIHDLLTGGQKETAPTNTGRDGEEPVAAFLDGIADDLTEEDKQMYWDDARDYIAFKIAQKKGKK